MLQEQTERFTKIPIAAERAGNARLQWVPWILALFFVVWSLRAVNAGNIVDTDAARHAMNGAFIHDMVRDFGFLKPIAYGKAYYGHLPALSMPYHPPLFPAIEALFFGLFGVSFTTARVLIALTTGLSVLLFYRLIWDTHHSHLLALFSVTTFLFWKVSQNVAGDVMLEFPSMVFVTAGVLCLRNLDRGLDWKNASAFAVLAAAAVWTKQHAVLVGLIPFAYYLFRLRLQMMFQRTLLAASLFFAVCVIALTMLSAPFHGTGVDQIPPPSERLETIVGNTIFYIDCFREVVGTIPAILIFVVVLAAAILPASGEWLRKPGLALYWAWAASGFAVLLGIGAFDGRYMFYVYPPLAVIVYASLFRLGSRISPPRAWIAPAAVAAICVTLGLMVPAPFMRGPAEAAALVIAAKPQRVLYCGSTDGNFIFAVRTLSSKLTTTIMPGDKFGEAELSPEKFSQFAAKYGIQYVVLEHTGRKQVYDRLHDAPLSSMILEHQIPLLSSLPRWNGGHLNVYRLQNVPEVAPNTFNLPIPKIGGEVQVKF